MKTTFLTVSFLLSALSAFSQSIMIFVAEDGTVVKEDSIVSAGPIKMLDNALSGKMIGFEREDGSSFQSTSATKFRYIDADGNETTNAKLKELYKANPNIYSLVPRVEDENVVFTLQNIRRDAKELIGVKLQPITYPDLKGKETMIPDKNKDMVLCFWTTWCGACVKELQILNGIAGDFPELKIVALTPETRSDVEKFFTARDYRWNNISVIPDYKEEYLPVIQNTAIPTSVLISSEGVIKKVFYGTTRQMIVGMDELYRN